MPPWSIRAASSSRAAPVLSLVLVRWAGQHGIDSGCDGEGGWGSFGCPPSDRYMSALVQKGIMSHPAFSGGVKDDDLYNFEIFSLFVRNSKDLWNIIHMAPWLESSLRGRKKVCFWMLWPAEWEDTGDKDYAGYVERRALFRAMIACEEVGLRSGFPHPATLYELITSKTWLAALSLHPKAHLPAAAMVSKGSALSDAREAARQALMALDVIRVRNPFPGGNPEEPAPSAFNQRGVKRGVVKLGWSWEGRFVKSFVGEEMLATCLTEMLTVAGCTASACIVQEWVDFDFEVRLYFFPPQDAWSQRDRLQPSRFEYNCWAGWSESENRPQTFRKLSEESCLGLWDKDAEAMNSAKEKAVEVSQVLLAWLLSMDSQPVPMIRLDFMLRRLGPGRAQVVFGEYCEMGACCLGWEDGPPAIWRAALDASLI